MRRLIPSTIAVALALFGLVTPAHASSYTSTFNPTDVLFDKNGGTCHGSNDETDDTNDAVTGFGVDNSCFSLEYLHTLVGFSDPPDTLTEAELKLYFYDASDPGQGNPEAVIITLTGLLNQLVVGEVPLTTNGSDTLTYSALLTIGSDGLLNVLLELGKQGSGQADFYFAKGVLNGKWTDEDIQLIPEPASMLLLGSGLAAVTARARRRARRNA